MAQDVPCHVRTPRLVLRRCGAAREDLKVLQGYLETIEASEDPAEFAEYDHRFHAEIARIGGSPSMEALLAVFRSRSRHYRVFALPDGAEFKRAGDEDHRAIITALANRDPAAAASAAAAHIARSERWLDACRPPVTEDAVDDAPSTRGDRAVR